MIEERIRSQKSSLGSKGPYGKTNEQRLTDQSSRKAPAKGSQKAQTIPKAKQQSILEGERQDELKKRINEARKEQEDE